MSINPFDTDETVDPFAACALDEETELRALAQAILFAEDFKLIFARVNQPQHRQRLIQLLREKLRESNVREIHFNEPITHLLDALRDQLGDSAPDALFVHGIEYSLPVAADAFTAPFVLNLNASRNSFAEVIRCPLIIWAPEYVLTAFMLGAPDFFSVRSGVYYFAAAPGETMETANALIAGNNIASDNLSLAEKQERVEAMKSLLADYEALSAGQRDLDTEERLHSRLGNLLFRLGMYDSARHHNQRLLDIARQTDDQSAESVALINLGMIFYQRGQWNKAIVMLEQGLQIAERLDDQDGKAVSLGNLANVYFQQQRWEEAQRIYGQCVELYRTLEDRVGEGWQLGNFGLVLARQGEYAAAEEALRRSVEIAREIGNQACEARMLINLGVMYVKQGRSSEAENSYRQSLETAQRIGMREDEWLALSNLAYLRSTQGDLKGAIELKRQAVEVLEKMDDVRNLTMVQAQLAEMEQQLASEQQTASEAAVPQPPKC